LADGGVHLHVPRGRLVDDIIVEVGGPGDGIRAPLENLDPEGLEILRPAEAAVARFMKLTQAMTRIKAAIKENRLT
jgi:hypothetical protein